jgi:hypothetical protein
MDLRNYLEQGLWRMGSVADQTWFYGHEGAAVLSISLFLLENELDEEVRKQAEKVLVSLYADNPIEKVTMTETVDRDYHEILEAIQENIAEFSADGHGVIYGAIALQALKHNAELPQGKIARTIKNALSDTPNRYWSIQNYKTHIPHKTTIPEFENVKAAAKYALLEQRNIKPNVRIEDTTYYFQGSKLHEITHAHALLLLEENGQTALVKSGIENLRKQMYFNRFSPENVKPIAPPKTTYTPFEKEYWENDVADVHYYKLAYSAYDLIKKLELTENEIIEIENNLQNHWTLLINHNN